MATHAPTSTHTTGGTSGLSIASFVVSIVAAVSAVLLIPGFIFGVIGLGLGIAGRNEVKRTHATTMWAATIGIILSALAILYAVGMTTVVVLEG